MKLTKDQRYTLYCFMLEEAENPWTYTDTQGNKSMATIDGICYMIELLTGVDMMDFELKELCPELYAQRTKHHLGLFSMLWDNWEERKAALKKAIELTSDF